MTNPTFQLEYAGQIYTTYEAFDVANGRPQPMLSIDDAEYWFGEIQSDEEGPLGIVTEIATGEETYLASCPTEFDRDGHACAWNGYRKTNRIEIEKIIAGHKLEHALRPTQELLGVT